MSFFAGLATGFAKRSTEKNDMLRKERLKKQEMYMEHAILPAIKDYRKQKAEYDNSIRSRMSEYEYLSAIGVPEAAQETVRKAALTSKGEFDSKRGLEFWQQNKAYFIPDEDTPEQARQQSSGTRLMEGNIDLSKRKPIQNSDGSVSTLESMSIGTDKGEVLIPSISPDGRRMSEEEAIQHYEQTGQNLGTFDSPQSATSYAEQLSKDMGGRYNQTPEIQRPSNRQTPLQVLTGSGSSDMTEQDVDKVFSDVGAMFGVDPTELKSFVAGRSKQEEPLVKPTGGRFNIPDDESREINKKLNTFKQLLPEAPEDLQRMFAAGIKPEIRSSGGNLYVYNPVTKDLQFLMSGGDANNLKSKTMQNLRNEYSQHENTLTMSAGIFDVLHTNPELAMGFLTDVGARVGGYATILKDAKLLPPMFNRIADAIPQDKFGKLRTEVLALEQTLRASIGNYNGKMASDEREKLNQAVSVLNDGAAGKDRQTAAIMTIYDLAARGMVNNLYEQAIHNNIVDPTEQDKFVLTNVTNYYMHRFNLPAKEAIKLGTQTVKKNMNTLLSTGQIDYIKQRAQLADQLNSETNEPIQGRTRLQ